MKVEEQTLLDLEQDAQELVFLNRDLNNKLTRFTKACQGQKKNLLSIQDYIVGQGEALNNQIGLHFKEIKKFQTQISNQDELNILINTKNDLYERLRILVSQTAGLTTATYWQSPSYNHSLYSQAGILQGKVTPNINDYSRDQSIPGNLYQKQFSREFIGRWRGLPISVFLTQSGMGALTTIINFLGREKQISQAVLLGKNSYFQNKELILKLMPNEKIEFDEENIPDLESKFNKYQPQVIFIDTISNSAEVSQPDMAKIIRFLVKMAKTETYLVIDNTLASIHFKPLKALSPNRGKLKLLVWESLNKYYQYGMDRTIGGFVWCLPQDMGKLFNARMHSGTIMSDVSQAMLPTPNIKFLSARLKRIERNSRLMAEALGINYRGGNLVIKMNSWQYRQIMHKARKHKVPLTAGTSFGLNISRIYKAGRYTNYSKPFIRLSMGTETRMELEKLMLVFK